MKFSIGLACGLFFGGVIGMVAMESQSGQAGPIVGDNVVVCPPGVTPEHPWRCRTEPTSSEINPVYHPGIDTNGVHHLILTDEQGRVILSPESEHTGLEFEEPRPTLSHPYSSDNIPAGPDTRVWTLRQRCKDVWVLEQP